jgi:hypothetical protein
LSNFMFSASDIPGRNRHVENEASFWAKHSIFGGKHTTSPVLSSIMYQV